MRILFAALLIAGFAAAASAQDAAFRFEEGKEYKYLIEETSLTIQELPGQVVNISSESTISGVITLAELLDAGHQKLQMTVENALVIREDPNQTRTMGNDVGGKSVLFEMDARGDVVDIDSSVRSYDEESAAILVNSINFFPKLDASKVEDGAEWETTEVDTVNAENEDNRTIIETERTYKIKGRKQVNGFDCHEIAFSLEADIDGKMARGDQEMMISGTREGKGTIMYAAEAGVLVSINVEINGDQTIMLSANNMRIPITSNQVVKVELVTE